MEKAKIDRINELARKAKTVGLTDEELAERTVLRQEYIEAFRAGTRATLESVLIQEADGTLTPLKKRDPSEIHHHEHHHHHHHDGHCCCGHHDHEHEHEHEHDDYSKQEEIPEQ